MEICPICHKQRLPIILKRIRESVDKATFVNERQRSKVTGSEATGSRVIRSRLWDIFHGSLIGQSSLETTTRTTWTIIIAEGGCPSTYVPKQFSRLLAIPPTLIQCLRVCEPTKILNKVNKRCYPRYTLTQEGFIQKDWLSDWLNNWWIDAQGRIRRRDESRKSDESK